MTTQPFTAIPGYGLIEPSSVEVAEPALSTPDEWAVEFGRTREKLLTFLRVRDPYVVLAKTAMQYMVELNQPIDPTAQRIQQPELELLQAHFLTFRTPPRGAPTSPGNFARLWSTASRHVAAFLHKQPAGARGEVADLITHRVRTQTVYYRNLFDREGCEGTLRDILERFDEISLRERGQPLSHTFRDLTRLLDLVEERLRVFLEHIRSLMTSTDRETALSAVDFFCEVSPLARRAWRYAENRFSDLRELQLAGFHVSELATPWVFTLPRDLLEREFPPASLEAIDRLSIRPGELSSVNLDFIYMDNPVWRRPFVAKPDGALFAPLVQLVLSFPFLIVEGLMEGNKPLLEAYARARAAHLEDAIFNNLRRAMPSAEIYRNVEWDDPKTQTRYENDVVAVIGNFIFLFEAKSGRISDIARRGGDQSLTNNLKDLFVEPGEQASRLQAYLDAHGSGVRLWEKGGGRPIDLKLDRPKVVFKYSVCIEHFTALTSAKFYLMEIGLIADDATWAPVLSLGELQMLDRFLDTEISFVHYLTRRSTLEDVLDFDGDEQDLLSMYLTNGFCIDSASLDGRKVMFQFADQMVRRRIEPRADRTEPEIHGVRLPPLWKDAVKEIYIDQSRHRFDMINVILNQPPPSLHEAERRIRKWRRGGGDEGTDLFYSRYCVGKRTFVLAVHFMKRMPEREDWVARGRDIAAQPAMSNDGPTDCAVFLAIRNSKVHPFDAVYFARFPRAFGAEPGNSIQ
jgi:hypothetical protein